MRKFYCGIDNSMLLVNDNQLELAINTVTGSHVCVRQENGGCSQAGAGAAGSKPAARMDQWVSRGCYWTEPIDFAANVERTKRAFRQWREDPHQALLSGNPERPDYLRMGGKASRNYIVAVEKGRSLADLQKCIAALPDIARKEEQESLR